jgi:hypothetical protein
VKVVEGKMEIGSLIIFGTILSRFFCTKWWGGEKEWNLLFHDEVSNDWRILYLFVVFFFFWNKIKITIIYENKINMTKIKYAWWNHDYVKCLWIKNGKKKDWILMFKKVSWNASN